MPLFNYQGRERKGNMIEGRLEANSADEVANYLVERNITPLTITPVQATSASLESLRSTFGFGKVALEEVMIFSRQMATLLAAGVSVAKAVEQLAQTARSAVFVKALYDIAELVSEGQGFAASMRQHPKVFSVIFVSVVEVGENSGNLGEVFDQLAQYIETEVMNIRRIKSATRYPTFVLIAIAVAIVVINVFVVPAFSMLYKSFRAELPWPTRALIAISDFFINDWVILLVVLLSIFFGIRYLLSIKSVRLSWDRRKLKIPVLGSIFNRIVLTRFAWAFSIMLRAGVPLSDSIGLIVPATGNQYIAERIAGMRENIERGENFTRTATESGLFSTLVLQMISVGEESGKLDDMLNEVAIYYERELDYDLKRLGDMIEPFLLVVVGAMVLVLALGVFLPMWDMVKFAKH